MVRVILDCLRSVFVVAGFVAVLYRLSHIVVNASQVGTVSPLGMMSHQDGLSHRNMTANTSCCIVTLFGLLPVLVR